MGKRTVTHYQGGIPWGDIGRAGLPVVGSVAGALIDKASQDAANKANAQNVQSQIDFQREQNATAYQRGVADLNAAGLNPALAYKQGGADSGSGASAENRAVMHGQRLTQMVDAYNQFANGSAQRVLLREQAAATDASRIETLAEAGILTPAASLGRSADYIEQYGQTERAKAAAAHFTASRTQEQYMANLRATNQGTATAKQHENLLGTQATLNEQQFQNEWFRKNVSPYLNSTAKAMEGITGMGKARYGLSNAPKYRYD